MLDLRRHSPAEIAGQTVTLEGRDYEVGARVREGDQGYAHLLRNKLSGLCLHVIQIRREYQSAPDKALETSRQKALATAKLRDAVRAKGEPDQITALSVLQAHGGSFELHEISWGFFREDTSGQRSDIEAAARMREAGDRKGAATALQALLGRHPNHTVALHDLAACLADGEDYIPAFDAIERAVAIEPNHAGYRGLQLAIQVQSPSRRSAPSLYEELRKRFPLIRDYDFYGIHAWLHVGEPARADEILGRRTLAPSHTSEARGLVDHALAARRRYVELDRRLQASDFRDPAPPQRLTELQELRALAPHDPDIQAALGFTLQETGDRQRAVALLGDATCGIATQWVPHCWANAAYGLLAMDDWKTGMALLDIALVQHERLFDGFRIDALPGRVEWISQKGTVAEKARPDARQLIRLALESCPDKALVTPAMRRLAAKL